jgi:hypothetical protein
MSRPDEAQSKSQPDAPELTPTQIEEKVAKDPERSQQVDSDGDRARCAEDTRIVVASDGAAR